MFPILHADVVVRPANPDTRQVPAVPSTMYMKSTFNEPMGKWLCSTTSWFSLNGSYAKLHDLIIFW
jgi:hypothetical protein